ncbi:MAG TPA: hypothetical protein VF006_05490 [Longimicrobium sp.]
MPDSDDLQQQATQTYEQLKGNFQSDTSMWRLGNTLDTLLDYVAEVDPTAAGEVAELAMDKFQMLDGAWFDDYAWWGIASVKASQMQFPAVPPNKPGPYTWNFKRIAQSMWGIMDGNAPYAWERATPADQTAYSPRYEGGVWNGDWPGSRWNAGFAVQEEGGGLSGIQNTVTNGLYLVLASRLYLASGTEAYLNSARREFGFLHTWFDHPDPALRLLDRQGEHAALVRERVSVVGGATDPYFQANLHWAGDQGLVLGGLVDLMSAMGPTHPDDYQALLALARTIMKGVRTNLSVLDVLNPWTPGQNAPGGDPADYFTGIGVYMRYLLYAFRNNPDLAADMAAEDYQSFLLANVANPYPDPSYPPDSMTENTNKLAVLLAAIAVSAASPAPAGGGAAAT